MGRSRVDTGNSSEALPRTFDAGLFSSLPIRFGQSGIAELYSAKIRENPKDAEYNSAIPGKTERFDQTNRYHRTTLTNQTCKPPLKLDLFTIDRVLTMLY